MSENPCKGARVWSRHITIVPLTKHGLYSLYRVYYRDAETITREQAIDLLIVAMRIVTGEIPKEEEKVA